MSGLKPKVREVKGVVSGGESIRPTLLVTVSTSWVIRNLFQTGVIRRLAENFDVVVATTTQIAEALEQAGQGNGIRIAVHPEREEPARWRYFRQIRKKIYMQGRQSNTDRIWARYVRRPAYQRLGAVVLDMLLHVVDGRWLLAAIERIDYRINRSAAAAGMLSEIQPTLILATHASSYFEESILHAADRMSAPVAFMVLSWDHLSSKIVMGSRYSRILAWNEVTAEEIVRTTGSYERSQIAVVGAPQFDCYDEVPSQDYQAWCSRYGLDPQKRTILFSTMPQVRHDTQHLIIEHLLLAMVSGKELPRDLQVLIKCHPFDDASVYDLLLEGGLPVGIARNTLASGLPQDQWIPADNELLVSRDALYFCSCNINIFSTVTLEAALLDKPIVHVAFDLEPPVNRIPCAEYYKLDHFAPIAGSGASRLVGSNDELVAAVAEALANPGLRRLERAALASRYFCRDAGSATQRVCDVLEGEAARILGQAAPGRR